MDPVAPSLAGQARLGQVVVAHRHGGLVGRVAGVARLVGLGAHPDGLVPGARVHGSVGALVAGHEVLLFCAGVPAVAPTSSRSARRCGDHPDLSTCPRPETRPLPNDL